MSQPKVIDLTEWQLDELSNSFPASRTDRSTNIKTVNSAEVVQSYYDNYLMLGMIVV